MQQRNEQAMGGNGGEPQWTPEEEREFAEQSLATAREQTSDEFPVEVFSDICACAQVIEVKSKAGIILTGEEKKARVARVIACGPGKTYENGVTVPNPVRVGDYVVFGKYASGGEPLWFQGKEYVLFRAGDIVGKLKPGWTELE